MALIDITDIDLENASQVMEISHEEMAWLKGKLDAISKGVTEVLIERYFFEALKTELKYRLWVRKVLINL